jgi:mono/diheme cytochrome c family protein
MPSQEFYKFSDADLGENIAYVKSVPPVDNELAESKAGPLGRIFVLLDGELLPASIIDHTGPRPPEPAPGVTAEYGEYMSFLCSVCHGEELTGGVVPGDEPDAPPAPDLTPGGTLANWSEEDFFSTLRSGTTPYGKNLDDEFMPWKTIGTLTDDQLKALWLYLKSLPAAATEE